MSTRTDVRSVPSPRPVSGRPARPRGNADPPAAHRTHRLPGTPAAPRHARRLVEDFLDVLDQRALADDADLVVSELVANAVVHGRPPLDLELSWTVSGPAPPVLRVEVHDGGAGAAASRAGARADSADAESGRGLLLVAALAQRWDIVPQPGSGTRAWAEIVPEREYRPG